ncbi:hypothetical protein PV328_001914 [Microctonus aethiopoides]|uniref:Uncharacterized protein n=1 Tax=Microctonus aethiopoides TaxID=144406 RepID=A0AA39FYL9_9HYME|nr:hypothetical protein PV328_001914 [Microctonus aethiopoides]
MGTFVSRAEKLSTGQKAPLHAIYSGGVALRTPLIGKRAAADVGSRPDVGRSGGVVPKRPPAPQLPPPPEEDGVIREETEDLKIVDGKPVRVVKGRLAYSSPEGLPVAVKYEADENGNRASFTIGTATSGGGGGGGSGNRSSGGGGGKSKDAGGGSKSGGGGGGRSGGGGKGDTTYLPPMNKKNNNNVDKSYLPPS